MMITNLILILTALLTFTILASYIIGAKVERFSKSYAISSGFINSAVITLITYNSSTNFLYLELWNIIYTCHDQWLITFLFSVLFVVIIPLGLGLFAVSLSYMFLHIEIWIILAVNKCVLIPISDNVLIYCLFYSYLAVCCSILFNIKTNKNFSIGDITIIFIRVFSICFIIKSLIAEHSSELLSALPALIIALGYDKVTISGISYANSAGNTGGDSFSYYNHSLSGSARDTDRMPTVESMLNPNSVGLTDPHWRRTVDKLERAANVVYQHKVNQNTVNGTNRSTLVRLGTAMNETNNPPFTPFTPEERNALRQYFVLRHGTTLIGSSSTAVLNRAYGMSVFEDMKNLN